MQMFKGRSAILTVAPGYGDALKEDQEQQAHATGRVVVKQLEHVDSALVTGRKNYQLPTGQHMTHLADACADGGGAPA